MSQGSLIIVLGDSELPEFHAPLAWLGQRKRLVRCPGFDAAAELHATCHCLGQIIATGRPGRFTASEIETLHAGAPLAPVVALVGAWCDGETRSGKPWPGVPRISWHSWQSAFEQLWGEKPQRRSLWLPRIAADLDRLAAQPTLRNAPTSGSTLIVRSEDARLAELLVSAASQCGWQARSLQDIDADSCGPVDAWLWDWSAVEDPTDQAAGLARVRATHPRSRLVVLQDFPRPEIVVVAQAAGADAVLGKPFILADVFDALATSCETDSASDEVAA